MGEHAQSILGWQQDYIQSSKKKHKMSISSGLVVLTKTTWLTTNSISLERFLKRMFVHQNHESFYTDGFCVWKPMRQGPDARGEVRLRLVEYAALELLVCIWLELHIFSYHFVAVAVARCQGYPRSAWTSSIEGIHSYDWEVSLLEMRQ